MEQVQQENQLMRHGNATSGGSGGVARAGGNVFGSGAGMGGLGSGGALGSHRGISPVGGIGHHAGGGGQMVGFGCIACIDLAAAGLADGTEPVADVMGHSCRGPNPASVAKPMWLCCAGDYDAAHACFCQYDKLSTAGRRIW